MTPFVGALASSLIFSFNAVSPLFLIIFLGWFIARRGIFDEKSILFLNTLCFRYLLPLYIFSSVLGIDLFHELNLKMLFLFFVGLAVIVFFALIIFSLIIKNAELRCIHIVNSFRSNNLIYALPLAFNLFGDAGLRPAVMLVPFTIISFNFISVIIMMYYANKTRRLNTGEAARGRRYEVLRIAFEVLKNPLLIGSAAGILVSMLGIPVPSFCRKALDSVAAAATPVALLLLGSQVDFSALKSNIRHALLSCTVRLVVCPVIITPVLILFGLRGPELSALAIAFAAPCAIATFIMARNYNIAPQFAAQSVYLSTVLSLGTIFCLITILRLLNFF